MNTRNTTVGFVATLATAAVLVAGCTDDNDNDGHSMGSMGSMMSSAPMAGETSSGEPPTAGGSTRTTSRRVTGRGSKR